MLDRIEIEAFVTLAEELHFGRTAERLLVTPGRVSQVIKKLERRVGAPLFERTSRQVRLTPIGQELLAAVQPAYDEIRLALRRVGELARGRSGVLRAGFARQWCGDLLMRAAAEAGRLGPGLEMRVCEVDHRDPQAALHSGEVDIQLTELPAASPDVVVGPTLLRETRALVVPAGHRLARRAQVSLEDLAGERLIVVGAGVAPTTAHEHHYPRRTPAGRLIGRGPRVTSWQDALVNVGAGLGVTPASVRAAQFHARPGIVYVPFYDAPPIEYALLWLRSADQVPLRRLVRTIAEVAARDRAEERCAGAERQLPVAV